MKKRTSEDYKRALFAHIAHITSYQNERRALLDIRRVSAWYLKCSKGARRLRESVNKSLSVEEALLHMHNFVWEEVEIVQEPEEVSEAELSSCSF